LVARLDLLANREKRIFRRLKSGKKSDKLGGRKEKTIVNTQKKNQS